MSQHSKYSIYTNYAYLVSAILLFFIVGQSILPLSVALVTLFAGSYWYHTTGLRTTVVFDYFGMYLTMLTITAYNILLLDSNYYTMTWFAIFIILGILTLFLKSNYGIQIVGGIFAIASSSVWITHGFEQFMVVIVMFAMAFTFRQIGAIYYPEHEDSFHAVWHVATAVSFIFMVI